MQYGFSYFVILEGLLFCSSLRILCSFPDLELLSFRTCRIYLEMQSLKSGGDHKIAVENERFEERSKKTSKVAYDRNSISIQGDVMIEEERVLQETES